MTFSVCLPESHECSCETHIRTHARTRTDTVSISNSNLRSLSPTICTPTHLHTNANMHMNTCTRAHTHVHACMHTKTIGREEEPQSRKQQRFCRHRCMHVRERGFEMVAKEAGTLECNGSKTIRLLADILINRSPHRALLQK